MKKLLVMALGLAFALGTVSFASAQDTSSDTSATKTKKKKSKKSKKTSSSDTSKM